MTKKTYAPDLILLLSAVCLASIASAQAGWFKTYGSGSGSSVQPTSDGGYIVAVNGNTHLGAPDTENVALIKTDASGDTLWTRIYDGTRLEWANSVQQTSDGGYVVAGETRSFGSGEMDLWLIKTNTSGDTLWTRTYGGINSDEGKSVQQTTDGGFIIAGYTRSFGAGGSDVWLVKTDAQGDTLWTRTYGGGSDDWGNSVQQTADGGYVIAGYTRSYGPGTPDSGNAYLVKTDPSGDTLWTRTYGRSEDDEGYSVQQTSDGGYIIGGRLDYVPTLPCVYLVRTNASGDTLWTRTTIPWGYAAACLSILQIADGGYVFTGYIWTSSGHYCYPVSLICKTNPSGDVLWSRSYGSEEKGYDIQQTTDGGYVISGGSWSSVLLIKTDSNGRIAIEEPLSRHPARPASLTVQPNPFTSLARVSGHETESFAISDITGRQVAVCKGDRIGEGLRPGVYFVSPVGLKTGKTLTIIKAAY